MLGSVLNLVDAVSGEMVVRWEKSRPHSSRFQSNVAWATDGTRLRLLACDWGGVVYVWDVVSARTPKRVELLFHFDTRHRVTVCSFIDSYRCIATDHGVFPIPAEHRPPCAAADLGPLSEETLLRLRDDGWIWRVRVGKGERRSVLAPTGIQTSTASCG